MENSNKLTVFALAFFSLAPAVGAFEIPNEIILKTDFRVWEVNLKQANLLTDYQKTHLSGVDISLLPEDRSRLEGMVVDEQVQGVDLMKLKDYLSTEIAPDIYREKSNVIIDMDEEGNVIFEGTGFYGRELDVDEAARMLKYALENNLEYITLPLITQDPEVMVKNDELIKMGIKEFISSGETDFSGSPSNRIHNINTGLAKFYGHVVAPGEEFSFNDTIGPINGSTGYRKELVIKGNKTIPEYGGGLCQVSTTNYRAILAAGYPIVDRRNHSYMVSYYDPQGLDATIYEGGQDLKFLNDTPHHLVMQSFTDNGHTYYHFYGTKPNRTVHMIGPHYENWRSAPATKTEVSSELAPGQRKVVGHAVPGVDIFWYRQVIYNDEMQMNEETNEKENKQFLETIASYYQARPNYYMVGAGEESESENEEIGG